MRGDIGKSDSEFFKIQKVIQKKNSKYIEDIQKEAERQSLVTKFARQSGKTKTLWEKIKGFFE